MQQICPQAQERQAKPSKYTCKTCSYTLHFSCSMTNHRRHLFSFIFKNKRQHICTVEFESIRECEWWSGCEAVEYTPLRGRLLSWGPQAEVGVLPPASQSNGNRPFPWCHSDLCHGSGSVSGPGLALRWTQLHREEERIRRKDHPQVYSLLSCTIPVLPWLDPKNTWAHWLTGASLSQNKYILSIKHQAQFWTLEKQEWTWLEVPASKQFTFWRQVRKHNSGQCCE
jgi:hypothetical protein